MSLYRRPTLFPDVFRGLGKLKDDYAINLREDTTPYALTTPRRIPIPLLPKVKEELGRMEKLGVITKIDERTDWCAGWWWSRNRTPRCESAWT